MVALYDHYECAVNAGSSVLSKTGNSGAIFDINIAKEGLDAWGSSFNPWFYILNTEEGSVISYETPIYLRVVISKLEQETPFDNWPSYAYGITFPTDYLLPQDYPEVSYGMVEGARAYSFLWLFFYEWGWDAASSVKLHGSVTRWADHENDLYPYDCSLLGIGVSIRQG